jgi:hypothetical protein
MPDSWARRVAQESALRAAAEYENAKKAETEKLLAAHYHRRRNKVACGFYIEHRKMPRGWHHALAARHPVTRKSFLPPRAIVFLNALYEEANKVPTKDGELYVFGKAQGFYAQKLGLSMRRNRNGEANGARRIREYLSMLAQLGIVKKRGRAWFDGPGKHPRLVLVIQPIEEWTLARFAEAVKELPPASENEAAPVAGAADADRISGSGCLSDTLSKNSDVCGDMGGTGGKEAPSAPSIDCTPSTTPVDNSFLPAFSPSVNKERPAAATQEPPSAAANEGDRATSGPAAAGANPNAAAVLMLHTAALRTFRGRELAELIEHVAKTHPRAVDAADGRPRRSPSPAAVRATSAKLEAPAAEPAPLFHPQSPRPHRAPECPGGPSGCDLCKAWLAAVMAPHKHEPNEVLPAIPPPPRRVQPSPWGLAPRPKSNEPPAELAGAMRAASVLDGLGKAAPIPTLEEALRRSIRWERTRCHEKEGWRCKPSKRLPCKLCVDVDFPFRATVDGAPWKLATTVRARRSR